MIRFLLYLGLFSVIISLVFSDPNLLLRGNPEDIKKQSLSISNNSSNSIDVLNREIAYYQKSLDLIAFDNNITQNRSLLQDKRQADDDGSDNSQQSKCDNSFTMWFAQGIAITTVECNNYSIIYSAVTSGESKPKYISGKITSVEITSDTDIKINGVKLSGISTNVESPTTSSSSQAVLPASARILDTESNDAVETVKVYSFMVGGEVFDVYLPKSQEAGQRNNYSLGHDGNIFYTGKDNNSKYTLNADGDLVDSENKVVLKGDSSSSAFKIIYSIPSLFAIFVSLLLL